GTFFDYRQSNPRSTRESVAVGPLDHQRSAVGAREICCPASLAAPSLQFAASAVGLFEIRDEMRRTQSLVSRRRYELLRFDRAIPDQFLEGRSSSTDAGLDG